MELTPEEISTISDLPSATPAWQRTLAARLSAAGRFTAGNTLSKKWRLSLLRPLRSPLRLAFTASAVGLGFIGFWFAFHRSKSETAEQLIAEAYTQKRTLPFRFPGAHYGPLRVTRGEESSHTEIPLPLLQAETQIASQKQGGNTDRQWLLASAYADILEGGFDHAIQILETDASANPDAAEIEIAIATAYYERGVQSHTPDDLGKAREAIGRALDKEPQNPIALFNRALIDEGMGLYAQAISDWQEYLQVDPSGEWSQEAREHLGNCQQMKEKKEKATDGQSLLNPGAISDSGSSMVEDSEIDRRIEDYQLQVFTSYYPDLTVKTSSSRGPSEATEKRAIRRLAEISALKHNDRLLLDFIASGSLSQARIPAQELASAIAENRVGDEQQALSQAQKAYAGFRRIGNSAGSLRAQFEMVYAMQFISRTSECITIARRLAANARHDHYSWLMAEAETQASFCSNMNGDLSGATDDLNRAVRDARDAHYEVALDRALVGEAGMQWQAGSITTSWNLALDGLKHFWASSVPYQRGESFCDFLDEMAEQEQEWHLQSAVLMESLALFEGEQDRLAEAQVLVRLAASQLMLHRPKEAKALLAKALFIFRASPQTPATQSQELMVRINLAKAEAAGHDYLASVMQLEDLRPQLARLHEDLSIIEFYTTLGESYRKLGNGGKAADSDRAAINVFRNGLSTLSRERDRITWHRQISSAYRSLVQLRIDQNRTAEALRIWQDYRGTELASRPSANAPTGEDAIHDKPMQLQTTIVYASLPNGPFAWAISGQSMKAIPLSASYDSLIELGNRFAAECSTPTSDIASLLANGERLYRILIAPFGTLLPDDGSVLIEPDDEFAPIPFSALVDLQGRYLNVTHTIAISPFSTVSVRSISSRRPPDRRDAALLVESRFALSGSQEEDAQSDKEIQTVSSFFPNNTTIRFETGEHSRFLGLLQNAAILHYAGHSASSGNGGALVLEERKPDGREYSVSLRSDDLEGTRLEHGKLAVLSACQTDRGQGQHWLDRDNLAVTLLSAGFPEVVASRWNIDSGATTTLMQAFYANVSNGISVPKSLRIAAETTRQLHEYQHPYFWAAFSVLERPGSS
jgi:CHAT domain-containing protein